ncbi:MAG: hypothetical protein ACI97A_003457 [Planctomycetota bacterium]|jgi:hypothetical protein
MKRLLIITFLLTAIGAAPASAQDLVRLLDGTMMRGEVTKESPKAIKFIDLMGKVHVIERDKIKKLRVGRPMKKKTLAKLAALTDKTEKGLWEVAVWCSEQKPLKKDSQRLARRVLVMNKDHLEAHTLLGHVKALGGWYQDQEKAHKAVEGKMTADGYVFANNGWIRAERAPELASSPDEWLLIDNFKWRPLKDVMWERGFEKFNGTWYPKEQKHLIPEGKALSELMEEKFHIAQVGSCRVLTIGEREDAFELATTLDKVRKWFGKTFEVKKHGDRRDLETRPLNRAVVLQDLEMLGKFGERNKKKYNLNDVSLRYQRALNQTLWSPLSHAHARSDILWKNQFPSQLGGNMLSWFFVKEDIDLPAWMWVASAHLAEIEVTGQARVPYFAPDKYGAVEIKENRAGRGMSDAKDRVKEMKSVSLRALMGKPFNGLTPKDDVLGMVYLTFLLEKYKPQLLKFLTARPCGSLWVRFDKFFPKKLEEVDNEFKAWLKS